MSLAYLRLEIFSHRRQIQDRARQALKYLAGKHKQAELPKLLRAMQMYKELCVLAGETKEPGVPGKQDPEQNSNIRSLTRYQSMWDRKFCTVVACFSGALVVGIPFVRIENADAWMGVSAFLTIAMAVSLVGEIFLVLYSSQVITTAFARIAYNTEDLENAIQLTIPETKEVDSG